MVKENTELSKYVDSKILNYTFKAKNFTQKDMDRVDDYCKKYYGNDRKKMILTLITVVENNVLFNALNDKFDICMENLVGEMENIIKRLDKIDKEEKPKVNKKVSWKGFGGNKPEEL